MANSTRNKVWKLDTTGTIAASGQYLDISKIRWVGGTTAGHTVVLTDGNDNPLWQSICSGANYVEADDFSTHENRGGSLRHVNGLKLVTLASGVLYIYFA